MSALKTFVQYTFLFIINYLASDNFVDLVRNSPSDMTNSEYCTVVGEKALSEMYSDLFRNLSLDMTKLKEELSDQEALRNTFLKTNVALFGGALSREFGTYDFSNKLESKVMSEMSNFRICLEIKFNIIDGLSEFMSHESFKWTEGTTSFVTYCYQLYHIVEGNCDEIVEDMKDPNYAVIWERFHYMIEKLMPLGEVDQDQSSFALSSDEMADRAFSLFTCFIDLIPSFYESL